VKNDTKDKFRKDYVVNPPEVIELIRRMKQKAEELNFLYDKAITSSKVVVDNSKMDNFINLREISLAKTKLEESIMWGVKGATKYYPESPG
jgi:hypothetical protein